MIYLTLYNIIIFIIFGLDKYLAIKGGYRISERFLITTGSLLGFIGAITAMILFNHKVRSQSFKFKLYFFSLLNTLILFSIYFFVV
ncbi:MAG: DUF1294 domain-containing protein [Bacilli bacterium]